MTVDMVPGDFTDTAASHGSHDSPQRKRVT